MWTPKAYLCKRSKRCAKCFFFLLHQPVIYSTLFLRKGQVNWKLLCKEPKELMGVRKKKISAKKLEFLSVAGWLSQYKNEKYCKNVLFGCLNKNTFGTCCANKDCYAKAILSVQVIWLEMWGQQYFFNVCKLKGNPSY